MTRPGCCADLARYQRGQVIILTVLLLVLGVGFLVYSLAGPRAITAQKNAETDTALAQVKQALIGWSASRTPVAASPTIRPGELPCPDMDNNGLDDDGGCGAGAIGRVPWKTLGIPEPRDGSGEILWYAIAGPFRYKPQAPQPITSDTLGNLTVYQGSSATTLTSRAIAVVFAPGPPLGAQGRGCTVGVNCTVTGQCTTSPASLTPKCNPTNYLETNGGVNNATPSSNPIPPSFIHAQSSGTFNDRLLAITNADLMPLVEQRVAREMMALLKSYYDGNGVYPWADLSDGNSNTPPDGYNRGRFPCGTASPADWGDPGTPSLPDWLTNGCGNNGWSSVIFYGVAKSKLQGGGSGCSSSYSMCSALKPFWSNSGSAYLCPSASSPFACSFTTVASGNADVILITPGASDGSPRSWPNSSYSAITGYFEDTENSDNDDDQYAIPSSSNDPNRDRMFILR